MPASQSSRLRARITGQCVITLYSCQTVCAYAVCPCGLSTVHQPGVPLPRRCARVKEESQHGVPKRSANKVCPARVTKECPHAVPNTVCPDTGEGPRDMARATWRAREMGKGNAKCAKVASPTVLPIVLPTVSPTASHTVHRIARSLAHRFTHSLDALPTATVSPTASPAASPKVYVT